MRLAPSVAALLAGLTLPTLALAHAGPLGHAHPHGLELVALAVAVAAAALWRWAR